MIIEIQDSSEQSILEKFKEKVADLNQDEITLIRFLRARDFDIEKSEHMLRECLKWRKENKIDEILDWNYPSYLPSDLPYAITGLDYDGGPVFWIPFGSWKHRTWVEQGHGDTLLRWGWRLIEDGLRHLKNTNGGNHACLAIFDLKLLNYYQACHIPSLKVLYNGFKALESNYPEVLSRVVIVNAPWLFSIPFNFIKGIISPNTLSKLQIFDSKKKDWIDFLLECAPQKSLPQQYFEDENGN